MSIFSILAPVWGPTGEHSRFQAGMGWLNNHDFWVTPDDPRGPLGCCWVIIW